MMTDVLSTARRPGGLRQSDALLRLFLTIVLGLGLAGCASRNVDPPKPGSHVGYLDFYADPPGPLSWHVEKIDPQSGQAHTLFQHYAPLDDRILRLAVKPGSYHLRISFFNLVTQGPAEAVAEVETGKITPVKIELIEKGTVLVESKETRAGGTYYGRFGRSTRLRENETTRYELRAAAEPPENYQPKAQMPYGGPAVKGE